MLTRRIIPCLDVRDGQVVKGVQFRDHVVMGGIVELALRYRDAGADELVFYDIAASPAGRRVDHAWVERVARAIDIPFCVAGGIRSVTDAREILHAGADKISVNTPALQRPELIEELAAAFGSQCVVVGIDSRLRDGKWRLSRNTGDPARSEDLTRHTLDWVAEAVRRGAGEIVLNCMGSDGVQRGYDLEQLAAVRAICPVPLIASGGAGTHEHFAEVFERADVDGALAASVFHSGRIAIPDLKRFLLERGVDVRPPEGRNVSPDFAKQGGLVPAIVQDADSGQVLMLGYMDEAALAATRASGKVTFFSRSKGRLWTKGETSGHVLEMVSITQDCDADALLVQARARGPTCHLGTTSCFAEAQPAGMLWRLDTLVAERSASRPEGSYTTRLFEAGLPRIAQKVGEEGVEAALAAVGGDDEALKGEVADLVYHLLVLLHARGLGLADVVEVLARRHDEKAARPKGSV